MLLQQSRGLGVTPLVLTAHPFTITRRVPVISICVMGAVLASHGVMTPASQLEGVVVTQVKLKHKPLVRHKHCT